MPDPAYIPGPAGRLATRRLSPPPGAAEYVWLHGLGSDMEGGKASALMAWAEASGQGCTLLEVRGHGRSEGEFAAASVGDWLADVLAVLDAREGAADAPLIPVGSSMGGWLALLLARERRQAVRGVVLVNAAPDFTRALHLPSLGPDAMQALGRTGRHSVPSAYDDSEMVYSAELLFGSDPWLVLDEGIAYDGPVRILQGLEDEVVPWRHALRTAEAVRSGDVTVSLVKGGDHRLSREGDITLLLQVCESLAPRG